LELHAKLPVNGEIITFDNYEFKILTADQKRIKRIKVSINSPSE